MSCFVKLVAAFAFVCRRKGNCGISVCLMFTPQSSDSAANFDRQNEKISEAFEEMEKGGEVHGADLATVLDHKCGH